MMKQHIMKKYHLYLSKFYKAYIFITLDTHNFTMDILIDMFNMIKISILFLN